MEEIADALAALQAAITMADLPEVTYTVENYRIVVSQNDELISVTRR